jgi:hypothetical protein
MDSPAARPDAPRVAGPPRQPGAAPASRCTAISIKSGGCSAGSPLPGSPAWRPCAPSPDPGPPDTHRHPLRAVDTTTQPSGHRVATMPGIRPVPVGPDETVLTLLAGGGRAAMRSCARLRAVAWCGSLPRGGAGVLPGSGSCGVRGRSGLAARAGLGGWKRAAREAGAFVGCEPVSNPGAGTLT